VTTRRVVVQVNGREHELVLEPRELLADVLRDRLGLTGTHVACEQGSCGSCTVLVDGRAVRSCLLFGVQADGRSVQTIEGVGAPGALHPVQKALADHHGLQCGFCTPGFVMAALELLEPRGAREPGDGRGALDRPAIVRALSGNICRCTGYQSIVDAVFAAVGEGSTR
jgi:aerobic-type carbon monoxide dehydrogenase small subunit (CoxS/CutS family)